jgi:hypothetical protein
MANTLVRVNVSVSGKPNRVPKKSNPRGAIVRKLYVNATRTRHGAGDLLGLSQPLAGAPAASVKVIWIEGFVHVEAVPAYSGNALLARHARSVIWLTVFA